MVLEKTINFSARLGQCHSKTGVNEGAFQIQGNQGFVISDEDETCLYGTIIARSPEKRESCRRQPVPRRDG